METLNLRPFNRRHEDPAIQIAPAHDCDGSLCHQPIFRETLFSAISRVTPAAQSVGRNQIVNSVKLIRSFRTTHHFRKKPRAPPSELDGRLN